MLVKRKEGKKRKHTLLVGSKRVRISSPVVVPLSLSPSWVQRYWGSGAHVVVIAAAVVFAAVCRRALWRCGATWILFVYIVYIWCSSCCWRVTSVSKFLPSPTLLTTFDNVSCHLIVSFFYLTNLFSFRCVFNNPPPDNDDDQPPLGRGFFFLVTTLTAVATSPPPAKKRPKRLDVS